MAYPSFVGCDLGGDQPTGYAIPSACFHTPEITITHGIVDVEYYKATGSEAGTGRGTHHFTIHNFRGRAVMLGKRNSRGKHQADDLKGVNERAEALKAQLVKKTEASELKQYAVWFAVMVASWFAWGEMPFLIIGFVILGLIFGHSADYDGWLEKA